MAVNQSSEALRRPLSALRLTFALIAIASLVLGYLGLGQFHSVPEDFGHRPIDLVYCALQLFVLGSDPLQNPGPYPPLLEIARFAAPAATLYALIEAARLLFAVELSRLRARRASGHAIVCGDTPFADALSRRLQAEAVEVIEIREQVDEFVTAGEPLRIVGDACDPRVLKAAGLEQASALYACAPGSAANAAIALAASRVRERGRAPLAVYSHIPDPDLCATLQASFLGQPYPEGVRLDFFNINHIAARRLFADNPLAPKGDSAPRVMVAGVTGFGVAVVVEAARSWRVSRRGDERLPISLVGEGADRAVSEITQRYPFLADVCVFTVNDVELLPLLAEGQFGDPPDVLLLCHRDEEDALKAAMTAERIWRGRVPATVVRLDGLAAFLEEDDDSPYGPSVFDVRSEGLRAFGVIAAACDPELIGEDLVERLARVIHERYREGRRQRGEWTSDDPSLQAWDRLSGRLKQANRRQAEDIANKLDQVNCGISPRFVKDGDAVLSDADVDRLAQREHERWCREYEQAGWRYAPLHSEERKLHPSLCSWRALPEHFRRRNHDVIRELADVLADAGFRIVRG